MKSQAPREGRGGTPAKSSLRAHTNARGILVSRTSLLKLNWSWMRPRNLARWALAMLIVSSAIMTIAPQTSKATPIFSYFPTANANDGKMLCIAGDGLSTLSGNHLTLGPKVVRLLREKGLDDVLVIMGGVIPPDDVPLLKEEGIDEVFGPETPLQKIVAFIKENVGKKGWKAWMGEED